MGKLAIIYLVLHSVTNFIPTKISAYSIATDSMIDTDITRADEPNIRLRRQETDYYDKVTQNMAAIFKNEDVFVCAGSLISVYHVLTGAHCVIGDRHVKMKPEKFSVRLGASTIKLTPNDTIKVAMWFAHPEYVPESRKFDVAVLELKDKVELPNKLLLMKLTRDNYEERFDMMMENNQKCAVYGWQPDLTKQSRFAYMKYYLQETSIEPSPCKQEDDEDDNSMVCALTNNDFNNCRGDSGGPLICFSGYQFAIANWNPGCSDWKNRIINFTRIDAVYSFIMDATDRQGKFNKKKRGKKKKTSSDLNLKLQTDLMFLNSESSSQKTIITFYNNCSENETPMAKLNYHSTSSPNHKLNSIYYILIISLRFY